MTMRARFSLLLGVLMLTGPASAQRALVVEETFLTVTVEGQTYRLEALVAKEAGGERLPVALITHGQSADRERREKMEARSFLWIARDFARRGWLAVVVVRRGFGRSEGEKPYALRQCVGGDYAATLKDQTDDLAAALPAIAKRSDADPSTVLALGVSVGGATVLDLAARRPEGLKAAVNISGGLRTMQRPDGKPVTCKEEDLVPLFASLGERLRLPTLWLYAENDKLFPADFVRKLHETYVAKGGRAQFHMFEAIGDDGHSMMNHHDGMLRWLPALDRFLRDNKLRTYDPAPIAAALAKLDLSMGARGVANRYEGRPTEKVLVVSRSNRSAHARFGGREIEELEPQALEECAKRAKEPCRPFLRNFEVVAGVP